MQRLQLFCNDAHPHSPFLLSNDINGVSYTFVPIKSASKPLVPPFLSPSHSCRRFAAAGAGCRPEPPVLVGGVKRARASVKTLDVATLGNLCVDVVLSVPELPPEPADERRAYMERLAESRPDKKYWEAGGNCNLAIAAARLGLQAATLGHVGSEIYGRFLLDVLQEEGIVMVWMTTDSDAAESSSFETLLCWVLVDPLQRHGFCSRADFSMEPAFSWVSRLSGEVQKAIKLSKILFCNGYTFDELPPGLITATLEFASDVETSIFFDPGPRGEVLIHGTPEQQKAINLCLTKSHVILLTADEAEALTGIANPVLAGQDLIRKGERTKWVMIKLGRHGSILISPSTVSCAPAFKVDVVDTVGCGDSCTAAVIFGFLHDVSPISTLALANAVGAATAMGCGAGRNVANFKKVLEILTLSDLYEEDEFWNNIVTKTMDAKEISLLSKAVINGYSDHLARVPSQQVLSELLPKLETVLESSPVVIGI